MTISRSQKIDLTVTPHYHCINCCVQRAFLYGEDRALYSKNCKHRCEWIATKIKDLSQVFGIDVAAYAVMHNHYHIVLRVDQDAAESCNVIERWHVFLLCLSSFRAF